MRAHVCERFLVFRDGNPLISFIICVSLTYFWLSGYETKERSIEVNRHQYHYQDEDTIILKNVKTDQHNHERIDNEDDDHHQSIKSTTKPTSLRKTSSPTIITTTTTTITIKLENSPTESPTRNPTKTAVVAIYNDQLLPINDTHLGSTRGIFDPSKSYVYEALQCTPFHRITPDLDQYRCDVSGAPASLAKHAHATKNNTLFCGGFPVVPYACFTPASGKFNYDDNNSLKQQTSNRWCGSARNDYSLASYNEETGKYETKTCDLVDLHPRALLQSRLQGKSILFLGDSHTRQLFTTFIAEMRNERVIVESHPDVESKIAGYFLRYEFNSTHDLLRDGIRSEGLTPRWTKTCVLSGDCIIVTFVWATTFEEQVRFVRNTLGALDPYAIITSLTSGHDPTPALSRAWTNTWENYLSKSKAWFIYPTFPKDPIDVKRIGQIRSWVTKSELLSSRINTTIILSRDCFHRNLYWPTSDGRGDMRCHGDFEYMTRPLKPNDNVVYKGWNLELLQYIYTYHTICQLKPTPPGPPIFNIVRANAPCTGVIERGFIRSIMTILMFKDV